MRYTRRGAIGLALGLAACSRAPMAAGDDDGPMRMSYGDHPSQFAELSFPDATTTPAPVVVVIHGGYWSSSYGLELGRPLAEDLTGRGFAVLNVEYRRVGDGGGWPLTGEDVAAAVATLAGNGRIDTSRVVALGHSAGGQLAGWLAAQPSAGLSGVVLQAGVLDLVQAYDDGLGGGAVANFLGATPGDDGAVYASASPIALLPLGIPSVAVHGTTDTLVPIDQSQRFVDAAVRAGDASELRVFDGDHFAPITVGTPAWDLCVEALRSLSS